MKKYSIRIFIVALIIAGSWVTINEVVLKPFPFLDVTYVNPVEWDEAPSGFTEIPIEDDIAASLSSVLENLSELNSIDSKVEYSASIAREIMRASSGNGVRTMPQDILSDNPAYMSICSESSKVFAVIMQLAGIPSRVVWMHGHTVSEVWNGEKWVLIDTYGNVEAFGRDGEPLGIREVIQDFDSAEFRKVVDDSNSEPTQYIDVGYMNSEGNVYENQNLLLVIEGDDLFSFHSNTRDFIRIGTSTLNFHESSVGDAIQLVIDNYYVGNFGTRLLKRYSSDLNE
jgi:hypothetical protein